ncbi:hypothetical protein EEX84_02180 [Planococcus salinus]|uniref:Uncharacterized protein n=1 Tax=Planococcus salinus TaxID=1848460 RepID=A0A3M8PBT4_9BACL|nr:hypothetical protein EEX84_02180 [Planococcus salinus]
MAKRHVFSRTVKVAYDPEDLAAGAGQRKAEAAGGKSADRRFMRVYFDLFAFGNFYARLKAFMHVPRKLCAFT